MLNWHDIIEQQNMFRMNEKLETLDGEICEGKNTPSLPVNYCQAIGLLIKASSFQKLQRNPT